MFTIYVLIEVHVVCGERKEKKGNTRSVEIGRLGKAEGERLVRLVTTGRQCRASLLPQEEGGLQCHSLAISV
jgi:hypothetical protein